VEAGIVPVAELGPAIAWCRLTTCRRIEEHDQVLREVGDPVDAEVGGRSRD